MRMIMFVLFIPMFMGMLMDEVHTYQKLFITKYFRSSSGFPDGMFISKYSDSGLQVID